MVIIFAIDYFKYAYGIIPLDIRILDDGILAFPYQQEA